MEAAAAAADDNDAPPSYTSATTTALPPRPRPPPPGALLELPILTYMRTHRVILASASPRRRALLAQLGLPDLEIRPSAAPEDLPKAELDAHEYAVRTAQRKALDVYAALVAAPAAGAGGGRFAGEEPALVIAADTVVVAGSAILEKPGSAAAHERMLARLRDAGTHRVVTGVCALAPRADAAHPGYCAAAAAVETRVAFAPVPDDVLAAYVRTREGADKAGGYALQGLAGSLLVARVDGPVDNVVGLPVRRCLQLCEKVLFRQGRPGADDDDDDGDTDEEEDGDEEEDDEEDEERAQDAKRGG
ncbi:Maf/Ham1 [Durotheca rogersii]|uniref:Maf/Ham1 n=1 Tax=Durotheca rogersii TaxID=419775 RepID=UPI00221EEF92|nr:Maf/Ham1 [Durotheca rogersii]KAI5864885.1 Maf/Ham1 [Durotheca rogersii]